MVMDGLDGLVKSQEEGDNLSTTYNVLFRVHTQTLHNHSKKFCYNC